MDLEEGKSTERTQDNSQVPIILMELKGAGDYPVVIQPGIPPAPAGWLSAGTTFAATDCPRGLEPLLGLDQVIVKEERPFLKRRVLKILDPSDVCLYEAKDDFQCWSQRRVKIKNADQEEIMCMVLEPGCCTQPFINVECPPGYPISIITPEVKCCERSYVITYPDGSPVFALKPTGTCCKIFEDVTYKVASYSGGEDVGDVTWHRSWKQRFTVSFPRDLHVIMKATLFAACIYIDLVMRQQQSSSDS